MQDAAHRKHQNSEPGGGVYESVKARIIAGALPFGKRIAVDPIADRLFVSTTPVREALIRLAAERVIEDVPKAGFFVKAISEAEVAGLYALQQMLLERFISLMRTGGERPGILKPPNLVEELNNRPGESRALMSDAYTRVSDALTIHIARQSGNAEVIHIVRNINDRTYFVRKKDFEVFSDAGDDLQRLCRAYYERDFARLGAHMRAWFRARTDRLPELLRQLRGMLYEGAA